MSVAIIEGQSGSETGHGDAMLDSSADCSAPWLLQQESKQNEDIIKFVYRTKLNHCESGHKLEVISRLLVTKTITAAFSSAQILQDSLWLQNLQRKKTCKVGRGEEKKMYCVLGSIGMDSILIIFTHFELVHPFNVKGTQTTISQINHRAGDYKTSRTVASLLFYI